MSKPSPIRFGNCVVDLQSRTLLKGGEPLPFEPRVFDALVYLIVNRDRVVTKQELLDKVWGRHLVFTSGVVARTIMKARRLAGQSGSDQLVIKTVHRVGYRFVAEIEQGGKGAAHEAHPEFAANASFKSYYPLIAILPVNNASSRPDLSWADLGLMSKVIDMLSCRTGANVIAAKHLLAVITPQDQGLELHALARKLRRAFGATDIVQADLREDHPTSLSLSYQGYGAQLSALRGAAHGNDPLALGADMVRDIAQLLEPSEHSAGPPPGEGEEDSFLHMIIRRARDAIRCEHWEAACKLLLVALDTAPATAPLHLEHTPWLVSLQGPDAARRLDELRLQAHRAGHPRLELWALHHLACHRHLLGHVSEASNLLSHALKMAQQEKDRNAELQLLLTQAEFFMAEGKSSMTAWVLDRAEQLARSHRDRSVGARALGIRGQIALQRGDANLACSLLAQAAEVNGDLGLHAAAAHSLLHLGTCLAAMGRVDRAAGASEQAFEHALQSGYPRTIALAGLAAVQDHGASCTGEAESSALVARMRSANENASPVLAACSELANALVLGRSGRLDEALARLEQTESASEQGLQGQLLAHRVRLLICLGRIDEAAPLCRKLLPHAERCARGPAAGLALQCRALVACAQGRHGEAVTLLLDSTACLPHSRERAMASLDALWICLETGDRLLTARLAADLRKFLDEAAASGFAPAASVRARLRSRTKHPVARKAGIAIARSLPSMAGLCQASAWPAPRARGLEGSLQQAEHEQQGADHDARPPRAQAAVEHDERLDDAENRHAE